MVVKKRPQRAEPNPFSRKRRANQSARYLNKREAEMPRTDYDRGGNRTFICFRDLPK